MLTSKSILVGALVLGAASVPAGFVFTDLGLSAIPPAPGAIAVEAPELTGATLRLRLTEPFRPVVLVPPAPAEVRSVRAPDLPAIAGLDEAALIRPELAPPDVSTRS